MCEPCKSTKSKHSEEVVHAKVFSKKNREQLEKIIKYSRSTEMSSGIEFQYLLSCKLCVRDFHT